MSDFELVEEGEEAGGEDGRPQGRREGVEEVRGGGGAIAPSIPGQGVVAGRQLSLPQHRHPATGHIVHDRPHDSGAGQTEAGAHRRVEGVREVLVQGSHLRQRLRQIENALRKTGLSD